jgi:hypothetical protein
VLCSVWCGRLQKQKAESDAQIAALLQRTQIALVRKELNRMEADQKAAIQSAKLSDSELIRRLAPRRAHTIDTTPPDWSASDGTGGWLPAQKVRFISFEVVWVPAGAEGKLAEGQTLTAMYELRESVRHIRRRSNPFAAGLMRLAYHAQDMDLGGQRIVLKHSLFDSKECKRMDYFLADAESQLVCRRLASEYVSAQMAVGSASASAALSVKNLEFVPSGIVQVLDGSGSGELFSWEPLLNGREFRKYSNNAGYLTTDNLRAVLAFSHFTHTQSKGQLMVTDLQARNLHAASHQLLRFASLVAL